MRYELLGPLRVVEGNHKLAISAHKIEILLAMLVIRANQVVSVDELCIAIWGEQPPRRAVASLHVYVSQLRKMLAGLGESESRILTRGSGYLLRVESGELDLHEFRHLMHEGRLLLRAQQYEQTVGALESALDIWRGPSMPGLRDSQAVNGFVTWLSAIQLECYEMLVEAKIALGCYGELVGFLRGLLAENPLHEVFHRQLMVALCQTERRGEALEVYRRARAIMKTELGLEPGRALRELHQAILTSEDPLNVRISG